MGPRSLAWPHDEVPRIRLQKAKIRVILILDSNQKELLTVGEL